MSYTVKIGFTSGDQSYPILKGSIEACVGKEGKHATQSTPVKVQSAACAAILLTETADLIPATLYHDQTVIFDGYIRPYRTIGAKGPAEDPVSLQIMDATEAMHVVTGTDVVYNNKTVAELVALIYAASGVTPTLGSIPADLSTYSLDRFRIAADEYWDDVLSELLYEYGYDFVFTPGACQIQKTTVDEAPNQSITDIRNNYRVERADNTIDGTIVEYKKVAYKQNVSIYSDDTRFDSSKTGLGRYRKGNYYNGLMHDDQVTPPAGNLVSWNYSLAGIDGLSASNVLSVDNVDFDFRIEDEDGIEMTEHFDQQGSELLTGARWWLYYQGTFNRVFGIGWGWVIRAHADITYLVDGNWQYKCEGDDPKKISAKYITSEDAAKAMASREYKRFKVCKTKYSFDSLTNYNVGEFYNLTETTVGVDTVVRVISKSLSADGIYSYQCEGADIVGLSVTVEELQVRDIEAAGGMLRLELSTDTISFPTDTVTATLSGYVTGQSNIGYKWYINETLFAVGQQVRVFNQPVFSNGKNVIKAEVWHTAEGASDHDVLLASAEAELENLGNPIVQTIAQYYHSFSLSSLVPNVFVETADTSKQAGKIYYEKQYTPDSGYVVTEDSSFISGKTYYEDASWMEEIINSTGNGYYVNGHLVPTKDTSKQNDKTYYYYDETDEEYEEFTGSTFDPNTTYYEFEEYPSYVWHRQKYVYSNGDISYSFYTYYLTTADVANPFTITTLYGVSTGTEMVPTTDVSPIAGKEYYVITNGKYVKVGASGSFPVGNTIYEIPGFIGWSEGIPSAWRKGLYVWYKETTVYDNQPENTLEDSPKYSVRFTQEMEATCAFEGTLQDYTWNKNMRSMASEDVAVNIAMKIVGYGAEATPIVRGLPSAVSVTSNSSYITLTFDSNINASSLDFTIGLLYPTEDSTPQGGKTYYYYDSANNAWAIFSGSTFLLGVDYYEDYPNVESLAFTINSVDITEKAMYLGLQSALPTSSTMYFLDGDHFVPTQNIVVGAITYYKYMPYVYSGGSWVAVQDGQTYGKETSVQIMYDCAKDIYHNANYTYTNCEAGDVAIAGVTYYNQTTLQPVVVAEGEDVSSYCTRHLDVPQAVIDYYNYQEKLMAEHIVAEDIELARGGKIRSAGYVKGTAQKIMDEMAQGHTVENYQPGFYGDYEGNFEAYAAVLVDANIYYCNIVGELRNELFETVTSAVAGAEYIQNTLVDESWSADEGIKAAQDAGMSNDTFTAISCQLDSTSYNYGMIVPDPEKKVDVNNIDPDDTRTMPIKAQLSSVTGRIFVNNTEVTVGSTVAYGATIKNKERWLTDTLYNESRITADKIVASNISWGGNSYPYIARITNPSATMISAWSQSATLSTGPRTSETVRVYIPDWFNGATCSCSMVAKCCTGIFTKEWYGDIDISKNGSSVIGGPVGSTYGRSATFTVNAGDYIDFYFGWVDQAYATRNGSYSISISAQSCSALGFSAKGFYTFTYSTTNGKKRVSGISNRGTTGDHFQSDLSVSMSSPISWASVDHCELASFSYTYGLYDAGFNFLNSSAEKQASLTSGMKPIATRFAFANFNSNSWDSNNANNHYFHLNSSPLKTGSAPVQSAKIFSIDHGTGVTCSFSYQRKGEALRSGIDIKSVIWSAANVTIERDNGIEILQIGQNNWYKSFTIDFTALAKSRGNYAESIYPMKGEADRTTEIKLGLADNRFDEVHTKKLGNRLQGTEEGYINNLNLIPQTGISSFITGATYYYFDNGILVPESSATPVSGRQYFILGSAANYAYFDTLAMLDSMDNQKKRIDNLFVKLAQVEQSLSSSTTMIPSSKAVNDAIMNIIEYESITMTPSSGVTITRKHTLFIPSLGLCYFSAVFSLSSSTQSKIIQLCTVGSKYRPKDTEVTIFCCDNDKDIAGNGVVNINGLMSAYRDHTTSMSSVRAFGIWFV